MKRLLHKRRKIIKSNTKLKHLKKLIKKEGIKILPQKRKQQSLQKKYLKSSTMIIQERLIRKKPD
jgi:hypothetical protein